MRPVGKGKANLQSSLSLPQALSSLLRDTSEECMALRQAAATLASKSQLLVQGHCLCRWCWG